MTDACPNVPTTAPPVPAASSEGLALLQFSRRAERVMSLDDMKEDDTGTMSKKVTNGTSDKNATAADAPAANVSTANATAVNVTNATKATNTSTFSGCKTKKDPRIKAWF